MARVPQYRQHPTRPHLAYVEIAPGKRPMLGRYNSPESWAKYYKLLAERQIQRSAGLHKRGPVVKPDEFTVADLMAQFIVDVHSKYQKNGEPTSEVRSYLTALRPVREHYQDMLVNEFGTAELHDCRQKLIAKGYTRKRINGHLSRIRRMFGWGVARGLVHMGVVEKLAYVEGVRADEASDNPPVKPATRAQVAAIEPFVTPQVWAMVRLQRLTGARPGEVRIMRGMDIVKGRRVWFYTPAHHKTEHHGYERIICLGPKSQELLKPWLRENPEEYLFQPAEGRQHWLDSTRKRTTTRRSRKQAKRPLRQYNACYSMTAYYRAIERACAKAFPPPANLKGQALERWRTEHHWHPHQIRHAVATRLEKKYGIEVARVVLGHRSLKATKIYAQADRAKAARIMRKVG